MTFSHRIQHSSFRFMLYPFSACLYVVLYIRHLLYDVFFSKHFDSVTTICVGNLSFGGTGKSPLTDYLTSLLKPHYKVAILSRGYKRKTSQLLLVNNTNTFEEVGDEPLMYKYHHPDVPVVVHANRVAGVQYILKNFPETQIIILDDALQHRRISCNINLLLTEFTNPYSKNKLFPMGTLRDIKDSAKRANAVIVTKTPDNLSSDNIKHYITSLQLKPSQSVFFSQIEYLPLYSLQNPQHTLIIEKELTHYNCIIFTGIANASPLVNYIKEYALYTYHLEYPDHHSFSENDIEIIKSVYKAWQEKQTPTLLITTEKDAMRLHHVFNKSSEHFRHLPIFVAPIKTSFDNYSSNFNQTILDYVATYSANKSLSSR